MSLRTPGLHHVTAVASDPRETHEFYADVLGLRFVKKTVNFDDTSTYHLYFGDEVGRPGTVMTFFPFGGGRSGSVGRGQPAATSFLIPAEALDFWIDRLEAAGVEVDDPLVRFGDTVVPFRDRDGQPLELVTGHNDLDPWADGPVAPRRAIRGFHGVTLDSLDPEGTGRVLELLGYERVDEADDRTRYRAAGDRAAVVDVLDRPDAPQGRPGPGTVHHVAFRAADDEAQENWRQHLTENGLRVTEQKDRRYFRSIYFREPGGALFEIATEGPGFTRDESVDELGSGLQLPPWLEDDREAIEGRLPPLDTPAATEGSR